MAKCTRRRTELRSRSAQRDHRGDRHAAAGAVAGDRDMSRLDAGRQQEPIAGEGVIERGRKRMLRGQPVGEQLLLPRFCRSDLPELRYLKHGRDRQELILTTGKTAMLYIRLHLRKIKQPVFPGFAPGIRDKRNCPESLNATESGVSRPR